MKYVNRREQFFEHLEIKEFIDLPINESYNDRDYERLLIFRVFNWIGRKIKLGADTAAMKIYLDQLKNLFEVGQYNSIEKSKEEDQVELIELLKQYYEIVSDADKKIDLKEFLEDTTSLKNYLKTKLKKLEEKDFCNQLIDLLESIEEFLKSQEGKEIETKSPSDIKNSEANNKEITTIVNYFSTNKITKQTLNELKKSDTKTKFYLFKTGKDLVLEQVNISSIRKSVNYLINTLLPQLEIKSDLYNNINNLIHLMKNYNKDVLSKVQIINKNYQHQDLTKNPDAEKMFNLIIDRFIKIIDNINNKEISFKEKENIQQTSTEKVPSQEHETVTEDLGSAVKQVKRDEPKEEGTETADIENEEPQAKETQENTNIDKIRSDVKKMILDSEGIKDKLNQNNSKFGKIIADKIKTEVKDPENATKVVSPIKVIQIFQKARGKYLITDYDELPERRKKFYEPLGGRGEASARNKMLFKQWYQGVTTLLDDFGEYLPKTIREFIVDMLDNDKFYGNGEEKDFGLSSKLLKKHFKDENLKKDSNYAEWRNSNLGDIDSDIDDDDEDDKNKGAGSITKDKKIGFKQERKFIFNKNNFINAAFVLRGSLEKIEGEITTKKQVDIVCCGIGYIKGHLIVKMKLNNQDFLKKYLNAKEFQKFSFIDTPKETVYLALLKSRKELSSGNELKIPYLNVREQDKTGMFNLKIGRLFLLEGINDKNMVNFKHDDSLETSAPRYISTDIKLNTTQISKLGGNLLRIKGVKETDEEENEE